MAKRQRRGGGRRKAAKPEARKRRFDEEGFYKKYPHVVPGSVKEVPVGDAGGTYSHGRVCQIKCAKCSALRTINLQDAWQTKFCVEDQKRNSRQKSAPKRRTRKAS